MSLLLTYALIDAIEWLENAPTSKCKYDETKTWKEKAFSDLVNMLSRAPWEEPSPDVERGIKFEKTIYDTLEKKADMNPTFKCSAEFQAFLDDCRGGQFQRKLRRIENIDGKEYCLYGKTDVWFPDRIIDIKACAEYGGASKYLGKVQHLLYMYIHKDAKMFRYKVAEFGKVPNLRIQRIFDIDYARPSEEELQKTVVARIRKAVGFLEQDADLYKLFSTVYSRY